MHSFPGSTHADGATQLFGFSASEIRHGHGHTKELFLKKWDAQSASEDGFEAFTIQQSGKPIAARKKLGDARHPPIEDAPGRYVRVRSEQAE